MTLSGRFFFLVIQREHLERESRFLFPKYNTITSIKLYMHHRVQIYIAHSHIIIILPWDMQDKYFLYQVYQR